MRSAHRSPSSVYWDPFDTEIDTDPYPVWAAMRQQAPLYRNDRYDFWALSRFADVEAASADPITFSSARGTVLEHMGADMSVTGQMIFIDPPEHTALRKLVSGAMTPRRIKDLEGLVRGVCTQLLDQLGDGGGFDYVQDFAAQVPSRVISSLVGVPASDQEEMRRLVDGMFHIEEGVGMANQRAVASGLALRAYLSELIEKRRAEPCEDMISALVQAEIIDANGASRKLTTEQCTNFALLLYTAGTETVVKLLGNAAVLLARNPAQRADLVANPAVIPNAVEELLRYEAPSPVNGRVTTRDVSLYGVDLPAGAKVLLLTGSAGRDELVYPDPDRFDVRREMLRHMTLGHGVHFCLGAALARLEGRVALEETLKRFPAWDADEARAERVHTSTVRGYKSVPVLFSD